MILGETVTVERPVTGSADPFGGSSVTWASESVDNVLVSPGSRSDVVESNRPSGVEVLWTLHFPKGYPATLRGARVRVRGGDPLDVIGDPQHYTEANTPGEWSMPCEVGRVDG